MMNKLIVNRTEIIDALSSKFVDGVVDTPLHMADICVRLMNALSDADLDVDIEYEVSVNVPEGDMNMNAYYDPAADEDGDTPVSVTLLCNEADEYNMTLSDVGIALLIVRVADAIAHEFIHARQYRSRKFKAGNAGITVSSDPKLAKAQEYLTRPDELEAYAYNIAAELVRNLNEDVVYDYLRMYANAAGVRDKAGYLISPNLYGILTTFGFDTSLKPIRKLVKHVYKYVSVVNAE